MLTVALVRRKAELFFTDYLRRLAHGDEATLFPWAVAGTLPGTAAELTTLLREEMPRLRELAVPQRVGGYQLDTEKTNLRATGFGEQTWPRRVVFASAAELLTFLGREWQRQARHIAAVVALLRAQLPELPAAWLARQLKFGLAYPPAEWQDIVLVARYFLQVAAVPGAEPCYVRELPLPVHTKFVEEHEAVLTALLRQLIPTYLNEAGRTFAARLRLREPELLVYVRILDPQLSAGLSFGLSEFMVPLSKFQDLQPPCHTVLITENKIAFLTLPALAGTVAVWGQGFAVGLVEHAAWLHARQVFYWGDLDAAGLQILNRLRRYCPAARPLLMDAATLAQYQQFQVRATPVAAAVLQHLTPVEQALFDYLAGNHLRLEQERIPQVAVLAALQVACPHLLLTNSLDS